MDVLKRINKLRLDRGWSVYRLANEAGLPQSTVINMFSRETQPSIVTLASFCDAFGITLSEFFTEEAASGEKERDAETDKQAFFELYESLTPAVRASIYRLMREIKNGQA